VFSNRIINTVECLGIAMQMQICKAL